MVDLGLSQAGKEELALAIFLWKEFKRQEKFDVQINLRAIKFADNLGIRSEYDELVKKFIWPVVIKIQQ